jgi:FecR protein
MKNLAACFFAIAATGIAPSQPQSIDYRFDDVRRSVVLTTPSQELKVDRGQLAHGGDKVHTGLLGYALIASDHYRAKFEIFGSTNVQLSQGTPGVIISLERGRLRAVFDKITGTEPRMVETPGALLAVRGTKYDVEVDGSGQTTVDVWEGIVEVKSPVMLEPIFVRAGQESTFGRHQSPQTPQPIPDNRRANDPNRKPGDDDHSRGIPHGQEPVPGHAGGGGQTPPHGGAPAPVPQTPQPAPPPHPPTHH